MSHTSIADVLELEHIKHLVEIECSIDWIWRPSGFQFKEIPIDVDLSVIASLFLHTVDVNLGLIGLRASFLLLVVRPCWLKNAFSMAVQMNPTTFKETSHSLENCSKVLCIWKHYVYREITLSSVMAILLTNVFKTLMKHLLLFTYFDCLFVWICLDYSLWDAVAAD